MTPRSLWSCYGFVADTGLPNQPRAETINK
jgi:hypothetical protein